MTLGEELREEQIEEAEIKIEQLQNKIMDHEIDMRKRESEVDELRDFITHLQEEGVLQDPNQLKMRKSRIKCRRANPDQYPSENERSEGRKKKRERAGRRRDRLILSLERLGFEVNHISYSPGEPDFTLELSWRRL